MFVGYWTKSFCGNPQTQGKNYNRSKSKNLCIVKMLIFIIFENAQLYAEKSAKLKKVGVQVKG